MTTAGGWLTRYRPREVRNSIYRYRKIHIDYRSKFLYRFISSISIIYGNTKDNGNVLKSIWCAILIAHQIVMAKHGGSCVHFSGISNCGRTSRETVSHSQRQPLPTPHKIALPVYVTVTNKRLQPLTTTLYNSLVLSSSLLTIKRRDTFHLAGLHMRTPAVPSGSCFSIRYSGQE